MAGLKWVISIEIQCERCGEKRSRSQGDNTPYKFNPDDDALDEMRMEFLQDLEVFQQWAVRELDHWSADGKFYCPPCAAT